MALRTGALAALLIREASASVCPNASPMLDMVTDIAPKCFEGCPELCEPIDTLTTQFMMSGDSKVLTEKVCDSRKTFDCVFQAANIDECKKVLSLGSTIGVKLPLSPLEFAQRCDPASINASSMPNLTSLSRTGTFLAPQPKDPLAGGAGRGAALPGRGAALPGRGAALPPSTGRGASPPSIGRGAVLPPSGALPMGRSSSPEGAPASTVTTSATDATTPASTTTQGAARTAAKEVLLPTAAPKAACTGNNEVVKTVMDMAPKCFEKCPYLCGALEEVVAAVGPKSDHAEIALHVCAGEQEFACAFQPSNLADCQAVVAAGASFDVPQTGRELSRRCDDVARDVQTGLSVAAPCSPLGAAVAPLLLLLTLLMSL